MKTIRVTEDERANLLAGVAFYAAHHRDSMKGTTRDAREHHLKQLRELSRLCKKVGGRDWIAEGDKP